MKFGAYYFAYGSNTNIAQMFKRCPDAYPVTTATLSGFALEFRSNLTSNGVLNIRKRKHGLVEGVIWNMTTDCIKKLDDYEGYPFTYDRRPVKLAVRVIDKEINAFTYMMTPPFYTPIMRPSKRYFERCAKGYEDHGLPYAQLESALDEALVVDQMERYIGKRVEIKRQATS